jgi:dienelactone hydrolase
MRAPTPGPQALPAEIAAYYTYPAQTPVIERELMDEHATYRRFLIRFPLMTPGFEPTEPTVEIEWYESRESGRRPGILLSPILGGDYPLERGLCRFFASHGFHVAMPHRKTLKVSPEKDAAYFELLLRQAIIRNRQVVDWMTAQPNVDATRLGSFGISMGAISNVMTAAVEPRLRCHVIALAGGSLADIIRSSHDKLLTKPRARYLAHHQIDLETMHRILTEQIRTDPLKMASYVDARRVLLVVTLLDRTIGTTNALRLRQALNYPPTTFLPLGHYTAYLALPLLQRESLRFFKRQLASTPS